MSKNGRSYIATIRSKHNAMNIKFLSSAESLMMLEKDALEALRTGCRDYKIGITRSRRGSATMESDDGGTLESFIVTFMDASKSFFSDSEEFSVLEKKGLESLLTHNDFSITIAKEK